MKILLATIALLYQLGGFAQSGTGEKKYLLLRIGYDFDKPNQRSFYKIIPDGWGEKAHEIYNLCEYNPRKNVENRKAVFYFERADTNKLYYNYFRSPTEALNYLAAQNWSITAVFPDNSDNNADQPNTWVSRQVFCFQKKMD